MSASVWDRELKPTNLPPASVPEAHQLIKFGYTIQQGAEYPGIRGNIAAIEYVTTFRALSLARN